MLARRLLVLMMMVLLVAFIGACGGDKAVEEPTDPTPEPRQEEPPPPVEDPVDEEPILDINDMRLDDVFFAFDKHSLGTEARSSLSRNADELKKYDDAQIIIEGHCDERGTKSYNLALGEKRANAARDYLVNRGISPNRITTISYGKERPFDMGHTEPAWAKNRRGHFVVKK